MKRFLLLFVIFLSSPCFSLVGGQPVDQAAPLPSVFIWTTENADLATSYCTGTKVGHGWILTAAHCILEQEPVVPQTYIGPWHLPYPESPLGSLSYSFSRDLTGDRQIEQLRILKIHFHPQVTECLVSPHSSKALCQYREPLPDVVLINVDSKAASSFSRAPVAPIDFREILPGDSLLIAGYGAEEKERRPPRLKYGLVQTSTPNEMESALKGTEAERDGIPDWRFCFGAVSELQSPTHVNLGSGDSGGAVFDPQSFSVIGINSDGFCPLTELDCQRTNNSTFARLDDRSENVGAWIRSVLVPIRNSPPPPREN